MADAHYLVHMVVGLPAGVFGEAYVVSTGVELPGELFRGEFFILTQRPSESLHAGVVDIPAKGIPPELGMVDAQLAREEALRQAEIDLYGLLEARAKQVNREDIAYRPFELKKIASPLLGCWVRGLFTQQLMSIKDATASHHLRMYLELLQQVSSTRRPG